MQRWVQQTGSEEDCRDDQTEQLKCSVCPLAQWCFIQWNACEKAHPDNQEIAGHIARIQIHDRVDGDVGDRRQPKKPVGQYASLREPASPSYKKDKQERRNRNRRSNKQIDRPLETSLQHIELLPRLQVRRYPGIPV